MKSQNETNNNFGRIVFRLVALAALIVLLVLLFGPSPETFTNIQ